MFKKPIFSKIKSATLAVSVTAAMFTAFNAYADVPHEEYRGSIEVTLRSEETDEAVPGGSVTLYKAGNVCENDGNYSFIPAEEFVPAGIFLYEPDAETARRLAEYALQQGLAGTEAFVDVSGRAVFTDLDIGLYLLVQTEANEKYYPVNPFLVSLPFYDDETQLYVYHVDASPKTEPAKRRPEKAPEASDTSGGRHNGGGTSGGGNSDYGPGIAESAAEGEYDSDLWLILPLPQTGQGKMLMAAAGIMLAAGIGAAVTIHLKRKGL